MARGLTDAVIVSGAGTGAEPDLHEASLVRSVIPQGTKLVIGPGAGVWNLARPAEAADTIIVGSSIKVDGLATSPLDMSRATSFVAEARRHALV